MNEIIILGAFGGIQVVFHTLHKRAHKRNSLAYRMRHSHHLVWLAHPAVSHTIQEYLVHIVVYSGKIIGH